MEQRLWWQDGIIYQIYPRSFQDSNQDGIGDLKGIIKRLDYLKSLGVQAIWISPVFNSPMADFGYDISDYKNIDPLFGTLSDFDELIREVHSRGMKLILDLVPNHTSNQHPWFLESRSSKDNPKRDWYIWKDPQPDGAVPNNWLAMFGGTAWEWDEATQQYYYHAFLKEQPDLNWRNPEVQEAMFNVMRFWLDKGVDGFRIDVLWHLIKDANFRDNPVNPDYAPHMATYNQLLPVYSTDQPEVHEIVQKMRALLDEYEERMMIGEIYLPIRALMAYYGANNDGAHLPFNFLLLNLGWNTHQIASAIAEYEAAIPAGGWPNWVLGNHDQPRIASRIGHEQAKIAAMMLLTLKGTPTIYYGEEIGMRDVPIPFEEVQDPQGLNMPDKNLSRDPARTPMPWDDSKHAGFSESDPWLRLDNNYINNNVSVQDKDPRSMLSLYKRLIRLRQKEASLIKGQYIPVYTDQQLIVYIRSEDNTSNRLMIILNLSHRPCYYTLPSFANEGIVLLSTSPELEGERIKNKISLYGDEGVIIRLQDNS